MCNNGGSTVICGREPLCRDSRLLLDIIAGCSWWTSSRVIISYTGMMIIVPAGDKDKPTSNHPSAHITAAGRQAALLCSLHPDDNSLRAAPNWIKALQERCTLMHAGCSLQARLQLFSLHGGTKWIICNSALRGTEVRLSQHISTVHSLYISSIKRTLDTFWILYKKCSS